MITISTTPRTEIDNYYVICPYCEAKYEGSSDWVKEYAEDMTCDECGSVFQFWAEYDVNYVTTPVRPAVIVEEVVEVVDPGVVLVMEDPVEVVEVVSDIIEVL